MSGAECKVDEAEIEWLIKVERTATFSSTLSPLILLPVFDVLLELFVAVLDLSAVHVGTMFPNIVPFLDRGAFERWSVPLNLPVFWLVREDVTQGRLPGIIIHLFSLRLRDGQTHDFA